MGGTATNDDILELGVLLTAAFGLSRDWVKESECRKYRIGRRDDEHNPWLMSPNDEPVDGVRADEMIDAARKICFGCAQQYECVRYAVEGEMRAGTWAGLSITQLRWLQKRYDWERMVDYAERRQVAIQEYIPKMRDEALAS